MRRTSHSRKWDDQSPLRVAAYPAEAFTGTVTYVGETVNPKTRRVTVRCEIPNTGGRLKPEMYATVEIGETSARSMVLVPSAAVQTVNGQPSVFISEADNRFRVQTVELGSERDESHRTAARRARG